MQSCSMGNGSEKASSLMVSRMLVTFFGQARGDVFLDVLQDALLDLAFVLYRAVQCVQRTVDAFQRPLFQKGAAKLDFIDLLAVVPVRP